MVKIDYILGKEKLLNEIKYVLNLFYLFLSLVINTDTTVQAGGLCR